MASESSKGARQKAAEARAEAEAADKRRQRIINISIGAVLVIVVLALVGGAWKVSQGNKQSTQPNASAALPTGAFAADSPYKYGVELVADKAAPGAPTLEIWEDYQCPACRQFEAGFGPTVEALAASGDANVIWRNTSFLDASHPGDHSKRAAAAWGCAIDAGKAKEYHDILYANQPATEGDGWTDTQLLQFGADAGITGDAKTTFDKCVTDLTYLAWAQNGTAAMQEANVPGTPGIYLNGAELPKDARVSPEAFKKAVLAAKAAPKQ